MTASHRLLCSLRLGRSLALSVLLLTLHVSADAADWPQFRFSANRGAASPETLPAQLHLQWVREFPEPDPAFPGEVRLRYDATYEPVVMDGTMFVPSMVTDSVAALDTASGAVRWRFFTGGPVRFAPVAAEGRVYFGSDDGHLYCVGAADGKLRWKYYGMPEGRTDRNLLGNRRLIPMWPVRGGPVLHKGVIYFAAGLWPEEGIFIHAVDATTGDGIWTNSDSDQIAKANLDHGVEQVMGLSPQGYLAVVDNHLVAPCGTQLPAVFDLQTGKLGPYTMGWGGRTGLPKGTWFVAGSGQYLAHSGDLYDMRRPNDEKFADSRGRPDFKSKLYPAGFTRIQIDPANQKFLGDFRKPVLSADTMFYTDNGIVAEDITQLMLEPRTAAPRRTDDKYPDKWSGSFPRRWNLSTDLRVRIQSGQRLYATGRGKVAAIDLPAQGGQPTVSWQAAVDGDPVSVIAAQGRLFVTTREGRLYAFGAKEIASPVEHTEGKAPVEGAVEQAAAIAEAAKATGGYCLVLGLTNGSLAEALAERFTVIAIDPDAGKVDAVRRRLHACGMYGSRISVHVGDPLDYALPPFLASLVVTETPERFAASAGATALPRIFHTLRPYGGTACLPVAKAARAAWQQSAADIATAKISEAGQWLLLAREGALPEAADWSHAAGNAGNTGASEDRYLRGPLGLLWYDGSIRWNRQPGKTEVRVAGGRLFVRADRMLAIDVFTGRRLWDRPLTQAAGAGEVGEFVASEDALYVAAGRACLMLDPATGEQRARFPMPEDIDGALVHLRLWKDSLVGQLGKNVICLDRQTGELQWHFTAAREQLSLAVGGGRVYVAELINERRGETVEKSGAKTTAVDINTGKTAWRADGGTPVRYSEPHDLLLASGAIYKGSDGSVHRSGGGAGFIAGDNLLLGGADNFVIHDLASGVQLADRIEWFRRGCTPLRTSPYVVTTRYRGNAAYIDLATRNFHPIWNLRGACSNNIFPANGVLNVPNLSGGCTCNYTPTSMALVPRGALQPTEEEVRPQDKTDAVPPSFPTVDQLPEIRELPNPFVFLDGTPVKNRGDWARRREEMKAILLHYQFGHAPALPPPDAIEAEVLSETSALGGRAVKRAVRLRFGPDPSIQLNIGMHVPTSGPGPFPVIVHNSPDTFGVDEGIVDQLVRRGYILASYKRTDLHPDWGKDPEAQKRRDRGAAKRAYPNYDWGCLRVWAWGGSVTLNWLSTLPEVDMTKIVCTGHSRGGQTAALMGMMDQRVAVVAPNAGGSITTGCHRFGNDTRRIKPKMAKVQAGYWYHPNLVPFGDRETRLPFDLHFIKAAVAPRAWFNSNGLADKQNVEGSMITWRAARVVYQWLGAEDRCAQWYRDGGHDQGAEDWKALADFSDYVLFGKELPDPKDFYQQPWLDEPLHFSWTAPR